MASLDGDLAGQRQGDFERQAKITGLAGDGDVENLFVTEAGRRHPWRPLMLKRKLVEFSRRFLSNSETMFWLRGFSRQKPLMRTALAVTGRSGGGLALRPPLVPLRGVLDLDVREGGRPVLGGGKVRLDDGFAVRRPCWPVLSASSACSGIIAVDRFEIRQARPHRWRRHREVRRAGPSRTHDRIPHRCRHRRSAGERPPF